MRAGLVIANIPANYNSNKNISYNPHSALDVYSPKDTEDVLRPVIVFFYGGRWTGGQKSDFAFVADRFARAGYVVVIPDHRKYPNVKFPAFIQDAADSVRWVQDNIEKFGGDPRRIHLLGHSSGAHIASLLVTDKKYFRDAGVDRQNILAFAGLAGPYAFTPDEPDTMDMFGPPENYPLMQATSFVDGTEPPMLLLHGKQDKTVHLYNPERLAAKVKEKGGKVELILYENLDHVGIIAALTWVLKGKADVAGDVERFFAKVDRAHKD